jgi:hypothetical protein
MAERDLRSDLLNTLLTSPHRNLGPLQQTHQKMLRQDPLFYVHLAAWYADHGQVRDHQEMFSALLCLSDFEGHRDTGLALLRRLRGGAGGGLHRAGRSRSGWPPEPGAAAHTGSKPQGGPRPQPAPLLRTGITAYLREREASENAFDRGRP